MPTLDLMQRIESNPKRLAHVIRVVGAINAELKEILCTASYARMYAWVASKVVYRPGKISRPK